MENLDMCGMDLFMSGNIYTGSRGGFRYRVQPKEGKLITSYYYTYCFEKADPVVTEEFPLDEAGYGQMLAWLTAQADKA